uniref:Rab-GAP TBC domain-containing protein n=1 Tax=Macrostomum lignano TaxID=282301 RepID=A0A1I8FIV3_9PLAT
MDEQVRMSYQDQLVETIMRVLHANSHLHYYQGYHDIVITFLLVLDSRHAYNVVEAVSKSHLREHLYPSMADPRGKRIADLIEKHEVPPAFSVAWVITWFGHVLDDLDAILRLYDFFLASHPLMPLYFSAALVLHKQDRLLSLPPEDIDFAVLHSCLANIPNSGAIQLETVISEACRLFILHPPDTVQSPSCSNCFEQPGGQRKPRSRLGLLMVKAQVSLPHLLRSRGALLILLAVLVALLAVLWAQLLRPPAELLHLGPGQMPSIQLLKSHKSFSKRPIQQLEAVIPEAEAADNPTCACAFTSSSGCCSTTGLLAPGSSPSSARNSPCPPRPEAVSWIGPTALCVALKTDYFRIRVDDGRNLELFPFSPATGPDSKTMFVNEKGAGDAVRKANDGPLMVKWSKEPLLLQYLAPFLIGICADFVEVRTVDQRTSLIQNLGHSEPAQRQPAPRRVVRCLCQVSLPACHPRPLSAQIKVLIQRRDFELALRLHEIGPVGSGQGRTSCGTLTLSLVEVPLRLQPVLCQRQFAESLDLAYFALAQVFVFAVRKKLLAQIAQKGAAAASYSELGVPYQDLIFRYSRWIIERDPKEGLRIFTESQADGDNALPRIEVANFLESSAPQLLTDYLEHCVLHCKPPDTSESLHTRLANQYRLRLEQQTGPLAVAGARSRLLAFLRRSRHYNAQELLARYPNNDMLEERALLLSRLGQYELAFTILAQYLESPEKAESLAEEILSQPTAETGDAADSSLAILQGEVYGQLIKALLAAPAAEAYKLHVSRA